MWCGGGRGVWKEEGGWLMGGVMEMEERWIREVESGHSEVEGFQFGGSEGAATAYSLVLLPIRTGSVVCSQASACLILYPSILSSSSNMGYFFFGQPKTEILYLYSHSVLYVRMYNTVFVPGGLYWVIQLCYSI